MTSVSKKVLFIFLICSLITPNLYGQNVEDHTGTAPAPITEESVGYIQTEQPLPQDPNLVSINLQDTDAQQAVQILGDLTDTIVLTHPDLSGTINIPQLTEVSKDDVVKILKSALMAKGFTVTRSGKVLKVIPLKDTKQKNVSVKVGTSPDDISDQDLVITQVMPLKYSSAVNLKTVLQPLVGKFGNILANERTNTLVITDISSNIKRLATIVSQMERPMPSEMQVQTYILNYGDSEKVAEILNNLSNAETSAPYPASSQIVTEKGSVEIFGEIQAYPELETNSIVVASAAINFPTIGQVIKKLDVFPPQAMIEVVIMDVTLDDDFTMGVEFSDSSSPTLTTAGWKGDLTNDAFKESIFHSFLGLSTDAATAGFTYRLLSEDGARQALGYLLNTVENSEVVSTPKILASNNEESSITVGQEIPIIESSTTDLANNVTNTDYRYEDVGLNLTVTPRISSDGFVNMKVHAELKDLNAQTLFNASIINKREADATVILPDGYTVVLGGLIRDNNSVIEKKIPLLGDIPFLGVLFKKTTTSIYKTELLIFLTPRIVQTTADLDKVSAEARARGDRIKAVLTTGELKDAVQTMVGYKKDKKSKKKENDNNSGSNNFATTNAEGNQDE